VAPTLLVASIARAGLRRSGAAVASTPHLVRSAAWACVLCRRTGGL